MLQQRSHDISSASSLNYRSIKKLLYVSQHAAMTEGDNLLVGAPASHPSR